MVGSATQIEQAAATHRQAAAVVAAARATLDGYAVRSRSATEARSVRELAERLRAAAALLAPGWLGAPLDAVPASAPLGVTDRPELVRIGTAYPLDDTSFPVVVPLGHVAFDGDARDARVAGALRAVLLRLLASAHPGSLLVRGVDARATMIPTGATAPPQATDLALDQGAAEAAFAGYAPLHDAGIMPPPVSERAGLQALLDQAEQWVRGGRDGPVRTLLLVIASWPLTTEAEDLARLSALAEAGPATGLHLLVAGWPPPPLVGEVTDQPLSHATQVTLRNPYALVGHPPGGSFGTPVPPGQAPSAGLNAQVYLDESPSTDLIARVCGDLADRAGDAARASLGELLPDGPVWTRSANAMLEVAVGRAGDAAVQLRLGGATPHWLIVGEPGSGKSALLLDLAYGLCTRYGPDQLNVYLLDFTGAATFADLVPSPADPAFLPHARAVGVELSRADGLALLRALGTELGRRTEGARVLPRIACLIEGVGTLLAGSDPVAEEAAGLLRMLAEQGGEHGLHLVLAGRSMPPQPVAAACRVRIALPGGSDALDPANRAAVGLARGAAVINTAAGLGGPRGATRAHEQLVRFPDPGSQPAALAGLRHRLWRAAGYPGGGPGAGDSGGAA